MVNARLNAFGKALPFLVLLNIQVKGSKCLKDVHLFDSTCYDHTFLSRLKILELYELYEFSTKANECNLVPLRNILMETGKTPKETNDRQQKYQKNNNKQQEKREKEELIIII